MRQPRHEQRDLAVFPDEELVGRDELDHLVEVGIHLVDCDEQAGAVLFELVEEGVHAGAPVGLLLAALPRDAAHACELDAGELVLRRRGDEVGGCLLCALNDVFEHAGRGGDIGADPAEALGFLREEREHDGFAAAARANEDAAELGAAEPVLEGADECIDDGLAPGQVLRHPPELRREGIFEYRSLCLCHCAPRKHRLLP